MSEGKCADCGEVDDLNDRDLCESCEEVADPRSNEVCEICRDRPAVTYVGGHPHCEECDD